MTYELCHTQRGKRLHYRAVGAAVALCNRKPAAVQLRDQLHRNDPICHTCAVRQDAATQEATP